MVTKREETVSRAARHAAALYSNNVYSSEIQRFRCLSLQARVVAMEMSMYTCMTCRVAFPDADLQRAHYKTDWHRYNLKRKVGAMPPVTAENFQKRVLAQRAQVRCLRS